MARTNLTRADLADIAYSAGATLSRVDAKKLVDDFVEEISRALIADGGLSIRGFGGFKVRAKAARLGRNPKTAVAVEIAPRRVLTFKPSAQLRDAVNAGRREAVSFEAEAQVLYQAPLAKARRGSASR